MTPRFCITGTGRSGSGYIARVLTEAGVRCGHEDWWTVPNGRIRTNLVGDSSWLAIGHLDDFDGPIYHQVRHPLRCITSLADGETYQNTPPVHYRSRVVGGFNGEPVVDALRVYVHYVTEAEKLALRTWRVEDVDADLIVSLGATTDAAERAIERVPNTFNHATRRDQLTLDGLPDGDDKDRMLEFAVRFGYDL